MSKLFAPSSTLLLTMIAAAEAKFAGDREQAALRNEAAEVAAEKRRDVLLLRGLSRAVRGRHYDAIQKGGAW